MSLLRLSYERCLKRSMPGDKRLITRSDDGYGGPASQKQGGAATRNSKWTLISRWRSSWQSVVTRRFLVLRTQLASTASWATGYRLPAGYFVSALLSFGSAWRPFVRDVFRDDCCSRWRSISWRCLIQPSNPPCCSMSCSRTRRTSATLGSSIMISVSESLGPSSFAESFRERPTTAHAISVGGRWLRAVLARPGW